MRGAVRRGPETRSGSLRRRSGEGGGSPRRLANDRDSAAPGDHDSSEAARVRSARTRPVRDLPPESVIRHREQPRWIDSARIELEAVGLARRKPRLRFFEAREEQRVAVRPTERPLSARFRRPWTLRLLDGPRNDDRRDSSHGEAEEKLSRSACHSCSRGGIAFAALRGRNRATKITRNSPENDIQHPVRRPGAEYSRT